MAISIDWATKVISVPKSFMDLVQTTPTEIRNLDLNVFRLALKDLEDGEEGIPFLDTHRHNTEVALGGLVYARVIEIINGYTVTFEDGQYAVNLLGANSNVGDVVNLNQVSVRSANAAGLISNSAIEYASFDGGVTIDVVNGESGTVYNTGTPERPSNNLADALLIAEYRGLTKLLIRGDITISNGIDISDYEIIGQSQVKTTVTLTTGAITDGVEINNATVTGVLDGDTLLYDCIVSDINYFNGYIKNCGLKGTIFLAGGKNAILPNCYTIDQDNPPIIDMGSVGQSLAMPNYSGLLTVRNLDDPTSEVGVGINAGQIVLEPTITAGTIIISGVGLLSDQTTGTAYVNTDGLMSKSTVADAVLNTSLIEYAENQNTVSSSLILGAYDDKVSVDSSTSYSGILYPVGTTACPVNNIDDAAVIANNNGFDELHFNNINHTFLDGDFLEDFVLTGNGLQNTMFTFEPGSILANCKFESATCSGSIIGAVGFKDCLIKNITASSPILSADTIFIESCLLQGYCNLPSNFVGSLVVVDSWALPLNGSPPILDMVGGNFDVQFRNLSGYLIIKNCTQDVDIRMFLNSGGIILDSTVTAGDFIITGTGELTDNSTGWASLNASGLMSQSTVSQAVWDEPLDSSTHNVDGTSGRMMRTLAGSIIRNNFARATGSTSNQIQFDAGASSTNGAYDPAIVSIIGGVGAGQTRAIYQYNGSTKVATVDRNWKVIPDDTSEFVILAFPAREHVNEGLARGGTSNTIILNSAASTISGTYNRQTIFIKSGTGEDQVRLIEQYNGATQTATVDTDWAEIPDVTTSYVMLPTRDPSAGTIATAVWDEPINAHLFADTTGHQMYHQAYDGIVHVDPINGVSGTNFPTGTTHQPCNNLTDALSIADVHFMSMIHVVGAMTIDGEDVTDKTIAADSSVGNYVTINSMTNTGTTYFKDVTVNGALSGSTRFTTSVLGALTGFNGGAKDCLLTEKITVTGNGANYFTNCDTYFIGTNTIEIDGGDKLLNIIRARGNYLLTNKTGATTWACDFVSGKLEIASSCISGAIGVGGLVTLTDNSSAGCTVIYNHLENALISETVWNEDLTTHTTTGTAGDSLSLASSGGDLSGLETTLSGIDLNVSRVLGLVQENQYIDQNVYTTYNGQKLLTSARIRTYDEAVNVGTSTGVIATYTVTTTWNGDEMQSYKVIKV